MKKTHEKSVEETFHEHWQRRYADLRGPDYRPEEDRTWLPAGWLKREGNTFELHRGDLRNKGTLEHIATIAIDPAIDPKVADRIAWFLSFAPDVYRVARQLLYWDDAQAQLEDFERIAKDMAVLAEACGHPPFGPRQYDPDADADDKVADDDDEA